MKKIKSWMQETMAKVTGWCRTIQSIALCPMGDIKEKFVERFVVPKNASAIGYLMWPWLDSEGRKSLRANVYQLRKQWIEKHLGKISMWLYLRGLWVTAVLLIGGYLLDFFFSNPDFATPVTDHKWFQRMGAVVVGFGVLIAFKQSKWVEEAKSLRDFAKEWDYTGNLQNPRGKDLNHPDWQKVIKRVGAIAKVLSNQRPEWSADTAHKIAVTNIFQKWDFDHSATRKEQEARKLHRIEITTIILGTLVWAFGDMVTGYFITCGKLIC